MSSSTKSTPTLESLKNDLMRVIESLLARDDLEDTPVDRDSLELLRARTEAARMGRPCVVEPRTIWEIDRLGSVAWGPVFTSATHQWPSTTSGALMAPLCQLAVKDLPDAPAGLDGLVQVWMPPGARSGGQFLVRHIPDGDVSAAAMTALPDWEGGDTDDFLNECPWLSDMGTPERPRQAAFMLAGAKRLGHKTVDALEAEDEAAYWALREEYGDQYDPPADCYQLIPKSTLAPYADLGGEVAGLLKDIKRLLQKSEKSVDVLPGDLSSLLQAFVDRCTAMVKATAKSSYPCLSGTFSPIQYEPADRGVPLMCLETVGDLEWGDGGNAQLFFDPRTGAYFDWSCL